MFIQEMNVFLIIALHLNCVKKKTLVAMGNRPIHVYPINDTKTHYLESVDAVLDGFSEDVPPWCPCLCHPKAERQENGVWIIVHNSFDGREGLEWANEILGDN